jgi:DNA polymerase III subunit gamma/tau
MSYLVLARKLRPNKFKELIGQDAIGKTLINAIKTDRVAHAFLFTGPRGTGKTSCARILTKALNCVSPVDAEPCGECENCIEIGQGISTDVVEIDAASNRGIEHIRNLRDSVKFSPAKCQVKTYIIDEVHMLTTESFNALLKTLEEPPDHVKFILATTDHHKIPPTVISRCQRFDFSNIPTDLMAEHLKTVAQLEKLDISDLALQLIARSSSGGMRDGLTIMDKLISFSDERIEDDKVIEILGINDARQIDQILGFIIEKNLDQALVLFQQITAKGHSITRLVTDLMKAIKDLNLVKSLPQERIQWLEFLPDQLELYRELAEKTTGAQLQQLFDIVLETEAQVKKSNQAKICVEMSLVKMCSLESLVGLGEVIALLRDSADPKKKLN